MLSSSLEMKSNRGVVVCAMLMLRFVFSDYVISLFVTIRTRVPIVFHDVMKTYAKRTFSDRAKSQLAFRRLASRFAAKRAMCPALTGLESRCGRNVLPWYRRRKHRSMRLGTPTYVRGDTGFVHVIHAVVRSYTYDLPIIYL